MTRPVFVWPATKYAGWHHDDDTKPPTRVLVTGSREFSSPATVWNALDDALAHYGPIVVVHGACPTGADMHASQWAKDRCMQEDPHPADWNRYRRAKGKNPAGMIRNQDMVTIGAEVVLAFFQPGAPNIGTADCADRARSAGIRVLRFEPVAR